MLISTLKFLYKCFYILGNIFFQISRISLGPSFRHCVSKIQYKVIKYRQGPTFFIAHKNNF